MARRDNNRTAIKRHAVAMMPVRVFFAATMSKTRDLGIVAYWTKEVAP